MEVRFWSHLDDLCLLQVFKHLSMSDLIRNVGHVCTNWTRVQREELRSQTTLTIIGTLDDGNDDCGEKLIELENPYGCNLISHVCQENGSPWIILPSFSKIMFNAVRVPIITETVTTFLMDRLPNIINLTLVKLRFERINCTLEQMVLLISHYSDSLVWLKIGFENSTIHRSGDEDRNLDIKNILALFDTINRLESLRHLTLNINSLNCDFTSSAVQPPILSILSCLESFTTNIDLKPEQVLLPSLCNYALNNGDLISIDLGTAVHGLPLNELNRLEPQLAIKFTRVKVRYSLRVRDEAKLRLFAGLYVSLHSLSIQIDSMPMSMFSRCLTPLTQLVNLSITFGLVPKLEQQTQPAQTVLQLPSVRLLSLYLNSSHHEYEFLLVNEIFPNLQVLFLSQLMYDCSVCRFDATHIQKVIRKEVCVRRARIAHCMNLARKTFCRCVNLHTIKLDTWIGLQSLLPQGLITVDQL